ncbi:equilibrative nucleoside transporter 1-like [Sinocyclocheilus anshuiensis]|uniref:Equilibrative nucleoside transporter 1-like n=1 Tax=Sinocyclocheilus anshuiensis TaxID=1608454 RepID=A0A671SQK3_9TELE|nr:PREDICTED: equilibrative nucleoside transporter 1-like [Sinocyclocheilus anshuiensis]
MTAANAPRDRYNAVWIIFFILGLGTLLPWNFFMTATMVTIVSLKPPLMTNFNGTLIPQKLRISGSLSVILVVFLITAVLVKVEMEPLPFFAFTMIKIICINSFGAILQGSLFGLAGMLPASYTTPIMSGQGLAGTFAAFSMICALASGSALQDSAFGYFITACVVILLAIVSYFALPKMEFFQYYSESNGSRSSSDEENKMDLLKPEGHAEKRPVLSLTDEESRPAVSVFGIFKQIWVMALSVCFVFTITIGVFPAVTVDVKTTVVEEGNGWNTYFIPVSCFLLFNLMDWAGRSLTAVCMWPGKDSIWLPILVIARLVFVPLFVLCNVQPRHYLPVVFSHDAWYIVFMILFSFSNGYLASLCMCFGPKKVSQHEAETAGAIMAFFLSLGLAVGAALSFAFRAMI